MVKKGTKSSKRWLKERFRDCYVRLAYEKKLRSRAWFKLEEIDKSENLIRKGMCILDLGSSPGSWSMYAKNKVGNMGTVVSCDILSMKLINGVCFFKGDLRKISYRELLFRYLNFKTVNVVMSDMAPNFTGITSIDTNNSIRLAQLAFLICRKVLIKKGSFIVKLFQGEGFNEYFKMISSFFLMVKIRKPCSSRTRSREVFIVAEGFIK